MIGAEPDEPYDRPNLSKDYLAGNAPEDWLPLKPREDWERLHIRMELGSPVTRLDLKLKTLSLRTAAHSTSMRCYSRLAPVQCDSICRAPSSPMCITCDLTDCRAIIASTGSARTPWSSGKLHRAGGGRIIAGGISPFE
jgi:hypothetical protein